MSSYRAVQDENGRTLSIFGDNGEYENVNGEASEYDNILSLCESGRVDRALELANRIKAISNRFEKLSERVSIRGRNIYFDGDIIHNSITKQIVRFLDEELDFLPLVRFLENIAVNPNEHSRQQLYDWLNVHDFTITPLGTFIGYKGVEKREANYFSITQGTATVDGKQHQGQIPNPIGGIIEMPRSDVQFDPSNGCSYGLHVGTWSYASNFARGAVLEVEVNPRDVVSVPTDCNWEKLRCCRYLVVDAIDQAIEGPLAGAAEDEAAPFDYHHGEADHYYAKPNTTNPLPWQGSLESDEDDNCDCDCGHEWLCWCNS